MIYLGLVATALGGENGSSNCGDDRRWIQTTALIKRRSSCGRDSCAADLRVFD